MATGPFRQLPLRPFDGTLPGPRLATHEEKTLFGKQTALYRFYDRDRRLLYVGITGQPHERWPKHRRSAPWWRRAKFVSVEHWALEHLALDAERAAIAAELPLFNKRSKKVGD